MYIVLNRGIYILYLLFSITLYAQDYPAFNINIEDGLPSNTIYSLYQDSKGFVWIGTQNGLVCYNGVSFKKFSGDQLKSSAISKIQEDAYGNIWMINFYGQILYLENVTILLINIAFAKQEQLKFCCK